MKKVAILEKLKKHKELLIAVNVLFAALAISGQVGQNVTLPLWASAATASCQHDPHGQASNDSNSSNQTNGTSGSTGEGLSMDPFFVLSSASFSFVVIFGFLTLISAVFGAVTLDDLRFPQWQLFLIGLFDALNGVLIVYSSPSSRTAPFLQAILGNFLIPLTIIFRYHQNTMFFNDTCDPQTCFSSLQVDTAEKKTPADQVDMCGGSVPRSGPLPHPSHYWDGQK